MSPTTGLSNEEILSLLSTVLCNPHFSREELDAVPEFPAQLKALCTLLFNIRESVAALSRGDLQNSCSGRGFTVGCIKTLSANLRNLTWRMNNLAQGEYTEADPYMGEFSATFNTLIHELSYKAQELNALIDEYKNQSRLDMLTNLPNRRAFFEVASREILFSRRGNSPLCLIMADIDCFKRINDTYGHPTGDYVLQTIAHRIQGALRVEDFCCRFGGEEFLILLREAKLQDAADIAERLRKSCCTPPPRRRRFLSAPFPSRTRLCTAPRRRAVTASVANADAPLCLTPSCLRRHDGANAVTPAQFHGKSAQTSAGADARHQGIRAPYLR